MKKKFDSVRMMREIREKLSDQYRASPVKQKEDLKTIRKKYPDRRASKK